MQGEVPLHRLVERNVENPTISLNAMQMRLLTKCNEKICRTTSNSHWLAMQKVHRYSETMNSTLNKENKSKNLFASFQNSCQNREPSFGLTNKISITIARGLADAPKSVRRPALLPRFRSGITEVGSVDYAAKRNTHTHTWGMPATPGWNCIKKSLQNKGNKIQWNCTLKCEYW